MTATALLILFAPLAAFGIQIFVGRRLPRQGDWLSISAVLLTLVLALSLFQDMVARGDPNFRMETNWPWFSLGAFTVTLGVLVDNITIIMLVVVAIVSSLVHIYSVGYMKGDIRYSRYFAYLSLFTFSMNGIVLSNNMFSMYMFWELVGLSSYLLIGHWFEKDTAADASKKAFLTNRIGDIGMFIGIMIFFTVTGSFLFGDMFAAVGEGRISGPLLTAAGICLFMGAVGKSAQFPLHVWLPDAMEGPTPVSALIHAATMVAAGVYLTIRLFPLFTPEARLVIAYTGGFTAIFSAAIAVTQNDIKKVLAYSTVSQLGYMVMAAGTGAYIAGFFHLVTHAAFKAGLFLCSGSVIHAMHHAYHELHDHHSDAQDMRNMGGLRRRMPVTYATMLLCTVAISGVPLTSGFLSKDAILAGTLSFSGHHPGHWLLPVFGFGAALLTAFYMFRLIFLTFHGEPAREDVRGHIHESPIVMTAPLGILALLSLFIAFTAPYGNPLSDHGWFTELVHARDSAVPGGLNPSAETIAEGLHHVHGTAMVLSLLVAGSGIILAFLLYFRKAISASAMAVRFALAYRLSLAKFFMDEIYQKLLIAPSILLAKIIGFLDWNVYDAYVVNGVGRAAERASRQVGINLDYDLLDQGLVDGVGRGTKFFGGGLQRVQTGKLQNYLVWVLFGVLAMLVVQTM